MGCAPRRSDGAPRPVGWPRGAVAVAALVAAAVLHAAVDVPFLAGRVNDTASLMSGEQRERLEATLAEIEAATGAQVAVLTIDSLAGEPIEDFSVRVAETWKLGRRDKDDGVLILVAKDDRKMRIEVGYGLEAVLTDARCARILDEVMRPRFRAGDFSGGIADAADTIGRFIKGEEALPAEAVGGQSLQDAPWWGRLLGIGIFTVVVGVFSVLAVFSPGCQAWFLYVFLMPFYFAFPAALVAPSFGVAMFGLWLVAFPVLKLWLGKAKAGRAFLKRHPAWASIATASRGSGGRSSGGFSGGGGSFGGGGASGSW